MKKYFSIIILTTLISVSLTACSDVHESGNDTNTNLSPTYSSVYSDLSTGISSPLLSDEIISEIEIETVKNAYSSKGKTVYDAKIIDLNFDGKDELLVLTHQANPKVFEVWEKNGGKMNSVYSFGTGKVNFIDKILLKKSEVNGEKVYLFSFSYDEGNAMKADEVLSAIKKTTDGYEVEHLLSRGTITYSGIAEPAAKAFYRKGWSKYDIGMDNDYGDISKEEYDRLYEEYMG